MGTVSAVAVAGLAPAPAAAQIFGGKKGLSVDPGGLAGPYFKELLEFGADGVVVFGRRIPWVKAVIALVDILQLWNNAPMADGSVGGSGMPPDLLAVVASGVDPTGVVSYLINIDSKLDEANRKLTEISEKIDSLFLEIARLKEYIREEHVRSGLRDRRNSVQTVVDQYRDAKKNLTWRMADAARARQSLEVAEAAYRSRKSRANRRVRDAAQSELDAAVAEAARFHANEYRRDLEIYRHNLNTASRDLMNYTRQPDVRAPSPTIAVTLAMAFAVEESIHHELGRAERDFEPVRDEYTRWAEFADDASVSKSVASGVNRYQRYHQQQVAAAGTVCPGDRVGVKEGFHHLAYAQINKQTGFLQSNPFAMGVLCYASLKREAEAPHRAEITVIWEKKKDEKRWPDWVETYRRATCQTRLATYTARDPEAEFKALKIDAHTRPALRENFDNFFQWRAYVYGADDAAAELYYLSSIRTVLADAINHA